MPMLKVRTVEYVVPWTVAFMSSGVIDYETSIFMVLYLMKRNSILYLELA